jgi:mannonate dehydratase
MNRRDFVGLATAAAAPLSAAAAQSAASGPAADYKPGSAVMKLGCQRGPSSDEMLTHFARAGVEQINGYPEKGPDGIYSVAELEKLRERAKKYNIEVTMIQMLLSSAYITRSEEPSVMMGKPDRDQAIDRCCQIIRNCAKAGIPSVKYNMTILGVLSTEREVGRGGNLQRSWDLAKAKQDPPLTEAGQCMADCMWERIEYFLNRVVPVANEYKVRLACHPHDPGVPPTGFRGVDRVLGTFEGLKKFVSIKESPYHGLNFCQGTVSEMLQDPGKEILDVIRYFGQRKKIFNVHFRNIRGKRDKFTETYPDEGDVNFVKAIKVYKEVGYPYMLMPDHMPTHPLDRGGHQAFFFAYGYIRALIQAMKEA